MARKPTAPSTEQRTPITDKDFTNQMAKKKKIDDGIFSPS